MEEKKIELDYLSQLKVQHVLNCTAMIGIYSPVDKEELFFQGLSYSYEDLVDKHGTIYPRTVYESEHYRCTDLAMGFCSVLLNWSLWEIICKLRAEGKPLHAHENDIDFDFKALIDAEELFKQYLDDAMGRYRAKFSYDPARLRFLDTDDTLVSKIYFDEWSFFSNFFCRGLYNDLDEHQQQYVSEWWFAFERYMRQHYHIRLSTEDMRDRDRVLRDLYDYKLLQTPQNMTIEQMINDYEWVLDMEPKDSDEAQKPNQQEQIDALQRQLEELRQQVQMLSEEIVSRKAPLKDMLPKKNDYIALIEWLEAQKADGHDYYKEAGTRSQMCKDISPIVGWTVDQNSLQKAQNRR